MDKSLNKEVGERLREIRKSLGISQSEMADIMGVSRSSYSGYENGYAAMPYSDLIEFSRQTSVNCDYILKGKEWGRAEISKTIQENLRLKVIFSRIKKELK